MNGKGQIVFFALMLGVALIVLALALIPVVKTFVDDARAPSTDTTVGLDCNEVEGNITDYQKSQCVLVDLTTPYFFLGLIGIALIVIGAKAVVT